VSESFRLTVPYTIGLVLQIELTCQTGRKILPTQQQFSANNFAYFLAIYAYFKRALYTHWKKQLRGSPLHKIFLYKETGTLN
jgi:hypothetical protein